MQLHYVDLHLTLHLIYYIYNFYYFIIGFCGLWRRSEKKILTPKKSFAIIVAAHNEHAVIGQLVENLHHQDYPKELYDIFVIADNCSDNTAEIADSIDAADCKSSLDLIVFFLDFSRSLIILEIALCAFL